MSIEIGEEFTNDKQAEAIELREKGYLFDISLRGDDFSPIPIPSFDANDGRYRIRERPPVTWSHKVYDLAKMRIEIDPLRRVLKGEFKQLMTAFYWSSTPHGHSYWSHCQIGNIKMTEDDRRFVRHILDSWTEENCSDEEEEEDEEDEEETSSSLWKGKTFAPELVKTKYIKNVLSGGKVISLASAFSFSSTPQGDSYWRERARGLKNLNKDDREFLLELLTSSPPIEKTDEDTRRDKEDTSLWMGKDYAIENLDTERIQIVLDGKTNDLIYSFDWESTPQGSKYWCDINVGRSKLSVDDREFLQSLLPKLKNTEVKFRIGLPPNCEEVKEEKEEESCWRGKILSLKGVNIDAILKALDGSTDAISRIFDWSSAPHPNGYWNSRYIGLKSLTSDDKDFLRSLLPKEELKTESKWEDEPITSLTFVNVKIPQLKLALSGRKKGLRLAFSWSSTPQGHNYWDNRSNGTEKINKDDKAYMEHLLKRQTALEEK